MAADLGLVVHAAEADARERPAGRLGDALAERGLADAGRADEAQDRAAPARVELVHREVLEDAALDLLEAEVILVEDPARLGDVDRRLRLRAPRQLDQPVEVGAHHRVLAGRLGHALEALELLARDLLDLLGHVRVGDRLVELLDLGGALVAFAELLLDRAHLLAQQVLAVDVADRFARAVGDVARDLEHLDPAGEDREQAIEPGPQVEGLEQRLLLLGGHVEHAGDHVGELRRIVDALQRDAHLRRHLRQQLPASRARAPSGRAPGPRSPDRCAARRRCTATRTTVNGQPSRNCRTRKRRRPRATR